MRGEVRAFFATTALLVALAGAAVVAPPARAGEVRTVTVTATEFDFEPSTIEVERGERLRIRLRNEGDLAHNLYVGGVDVHSETVQGGDADTISLTPSESGTLRFFCNVPGHRDAGMEGTIAISG